GLFFIVGHKCSSRLVGCPRALKCRSRCSPFARRSISIFMTTDPVCGKPVDEQSSMNRVDYQERTFYFCSPECVEVFQTDPVPYVKAVS
ncbi:MAG TPA: YHS domain-containing protein, partial [Candidatus Koribacter sp.]